VAAAVLKETMVTEKAVAKIAAKLTAANVRVDYSFTSRLSSSFLKVIDQLNFRMDMQSFSANLLNRTLIALSASSAHGTQNGTQNGPGALTL
jgi:hypothetical protein